MYAQPSREGTTTSHRLQYQQYSASKLHWHEDFFLASHHGARGHGSDISDPLKRKGVPDCHAFDSCRWHAREGPLHARDGEFERKLLRQPIEAFIKRRGPPHPSFLRLLCPKQQSIPQNLRDSRIPIRTGV